MTRVFQLTRDFIRVQRSWKFMSLYSSLNHSVSFSIFIHWNSILLALTVFCTWLYTASGRLVSKCFVMSAEFATWCMGVVQKLVVSFWLCQPHKWPLRHACIVWGGAGVFVHGWSNALVTPRECSPQINVALSPEKQNFRQTTVNSVMFIV